ncbi:hypothetical protein FG385_02020, partial [Amycolatopsis alkalitolerans]
MPGRVLGDRPDAARALRKRAVPAGTPAGTQTPRTLRSPLLTILHTVYDMLMDLYEYQAKDLFAAHGVPVLPGAVAS